jgi:hypothetical protein
MGKTSFGGPVYGAKGSLLSATFTASSGASTTVYAGVVVPAGEDWYGCNVSLHKASTGSTGFVAVVRKGSTALSSQAITSSAAASTAVIVTADAGEYEGKRLPSGSTITFEALSPTVATERVTMVLSGFRRFVSSTRGE